MLYLTFFLYADEDENGEESENNEDLKMTFCNPSQSDDEKNDVAANIVDNVEQ